MNRQNELWVEALLLLMLILAMAYVITMIKMHDDSLAADGNEYVGQIIVGILGYFTGKEVGKRIK